MRYLLWELVKAYIAEVQVHSFAFQTVLSIFQGILIRNNIIGMIMTSRNNIYHFNSCGKHLKMRPEAN